MMSISFAGNRVVLFVLSFTVASAVQAVNVFGPGSPDWPVAWCSYHKVATEADDFADLRAHGVEMVSYTPSGPNAARGALKRARQAGMKYFIEIPDVSENEWTTVTQGLSPERAVMIGGVYRGKAVDRHVFTFTPTRHTIVIEPPVYNGGLPYTKGSGGTGARRTDTDRVGHYYPEMGAPQRAEVVVPLAAFDGRQHIRIIPAAVACAPAGALPENDTARPEWRDVPEIRDRKLYTLTFDLSDCRGALLDKVSLAVYWEYGPQKTYWMFGKGQLSVTAATTHEAARRAVRAKIRLWSEANGGVFPSDVVKAARYGDECFNITGHLGSPASNYPLWDFSASARARFAAAVPAGMTYPRVWGFPEIYGEEAYAQWLYLRHLACAELVRTAREEVRTGAPGLLLFRNTTRGGVFSLSNEQDGSGQELLARELDFIHLDPYPVTAKTYYPSIPIDMGYCSGFSRRYGKPLIPWMQAHTYGGPSGLTDVSPEQVRRMADEQWAQGVDAVMWLGYGYTFPRVRPDSWEEAGRFHRRLAAGRPPKPVAALAVLRFYGPRASFSLDGAKNLRHPRDWFLQRFMTVWSTQFRKPYDVFEIPPSPSEAEWAALKKALARYRYIVASAPFEKAWVIGDGFEIRPYRFSDTSLVDTLIGKEITARGWDQNK